MDPEEGCGQEKEGVAHIKPCLKARRDKDRNESLDSARLGLLTPVGRAGLGPRCLHLGWRECEEGPGCGVSCTGQELDDGGWQKVQYRVLCFILIVF